MIPPHVPTLSLVPDGDELASALDELRGAVLEHPAAAAAAWRGLLREGRAYAQTAEGARLRARIAASPHIERVRLAVRGVTGDALTPDGEWSPSELAEALVLLSTHPRVEALVGKALWNR